MVVNDEPIGQCEKCAEQYIADIEWCKPCQINYFKRNLTNWTSGNENIANARFRFLNSYALIDHILEPTDALTMIY